MNTLEMINDWKESNYKKKYITKGHGSTLPYTVFNNGVGVLFCSYFIITIKEPIEESKPFIIDKSNLEWNGNKLLVNTILNNHLIKLKKVIV